MKQDNTRKSNLLVLGAGNEAQMLIEALNSVTPESRADLYVLSPDSQLPEIELVRHNLNIPDSTPIVCPLAEDDLAHHPQNDSVVALRFGRQISLCLVSHMSLPEIIPLINELVVMPNGPVKQPLKIKTLKKVKVPAIKNFNRRNPTKRGK